MATLKEIVTSARATRADNSVDPKQVVDGVLYAQNRAFHVAQANEDAISRLAKVKLDLRNEAPPGVDAEFVLQLALKVDREKVAKEIAELEKVIANSAAAVIERGVSRQGSREDRSGDAAETSRVRGAACQTPCLPLTSIPCGRGFPGGESTGSRVWIPR